MLDVAAALPNPFRPDLMKDQVALVTGGGSGIGYKTAEELLALGARVVICGRNQARLDQARAALEAAAPGRVQSLVCDIREPPAIEAMVQAALERHGRIDVLVNNAGGQFPAPAAAISPRGWEAVVRNNLNGTFYVTREVALKAMLPQKRGAIVNVTANVARGFPGMAHTGAARAGVENLTRTLAIEWAASDVRVNAVAPGIIASDGIKQYGEAVTEAGRRRTPQQRMGTVEEVAHAIVYLASPASLFVTGAVLHIDGGASLWGDTLMLPSRDS